MGGFSCFIFFTFFFRLAIARWLVVVAVYTGRGAGGGVVDSLALPCITV